jgi:hypothetical protein
MKKVKRGKTQNDVENTTGSFLGALEQTWNAPNAVTLDTCLFRSYTFSQFGHMYLFGPNVRLFYPLAAKESLMLVTRSCAFILVSSSMYHTALRLPPLWSSVTIYVKTLQHASSTPRLSYSCVFLFHMTERLTTSTRIIPARKNTRKTKPFYWPAAGPLSFKLCEDTAVLHNVPSGDVSMTFILLSTNDNFASVTPILLRSKYVTSDYDGV